MMNYTDIHFNENNFTIYNTTCKYFDRFFLIESDPEYEQIVYGTPGYILWGIIFVLITIFGNIFNIMTIIVLKHDPIISTLTILLIGLAISDIVAPQGNAILAISHYHLSARYSQSISFLKFDNYVRFLVQPLSTMFTMSSSWIITTTTLFRLIAVKWPFKARTLINKRFAICSLICIFLFSFIVILPMYGTLVRQERCTADGKIKFLGFHNDYESDFLRIAYTPMLQILCFLFTMVNLTCTLVFLIRSLRNAERTFRVPKDSLLNNSVYSGGSISVANRNQSYCSNNRNSLLFISKHHGNNNIHKNGSICSMTTQKQQQQQPEQQSRIGGIVSYTDECFSDTHINMNYVHSRIRSYNRITLMIVVLCFMNLIFQLCTFISIFRMVYDTIQNRAYATYLAKNELSNLEEEFKNSTTSSSRQFLKAAERFPKFLSYILLLNNIFLAINHGCNIFVYTFTNPRFKHNLISLIKRYGYFLCRRFKFNKKNIYKFQHKSLRNENFLNIPNNKNNSQFNNNNNRGSFCNKLNCHDYSMGPLFSRCGSEYYQRDNKNNNKNDATMVMVENPKSNIDSIMGSIEFDKKLFHNKLNKKPYERNNVPKKTKSIC